MAAEIDPPPFTSTTLGTNPIFSRFVRPCCAEMLGAFILTFTSSIAVTAASESVRPLILSLVQGTMILALYGTLAEISGGHYNPAVTFSVWLGGGVTCVNMLFYVVCQFMGAFLGAVIFRVVLLRHVYLQAAIATVPAVNFSYGGIGQAILMELICSCTWSLTVLMTTVDSTKPHQPAGLSVGSVLFATSLISYNLTTASLNPARALGVTLAYNVFAEGQWSDHYVFWVGPFLGALLAALLYRILLAGDEKRITFKK